MSYKHNKSWRLRNIAKRNKQRKRYYKRFQNALSSTIRWNDLDTDEIIMSKEPDRTLSARLGRSIQAIQIKRHKLNKEAQIC